jgi:putative resolvase
MNTELVESALSAHGRRLVVLDTGEVDDDLVRDMVGRRSARNRALKAVGCAQRDVGLRAAVGGRGDDASHG